jgi:hypothetical protein
METQYKSRGVDQAASLPPKSRGEDFSPVHIKVNMLKSILLRFVSHFALQKYICSVFKGLKKTLPFRYDM